MHTSVNRNDRILINYRIYRIFNRIIDRIFKIQQIRSTIRSTLRNFEHYLEHFNEFSSTMRSSQVGSKTVSLSQQH
jgi:hypothetical protein